MIRAWCGVPTECVESQAQQFNSLLSKIGIKFVFMHSECCLSTTLERSAEEIDTLERTHPGSNNFPLQPNSLYSYTPLTGTPSSTRHPVIKILEEKPKKTKPQTVYLSLSLSQEKDYKDLPLTVFKDITFLEEISNKEVGWYNQKANIVWVSDIFHFLDDTPNILSKIIDTIIEYKRYGKVQDILTIGTDPEFEIIGENDDFVEAHKIFGEKGGEIGHDDNSSTGELRPKPDKSPLGLTRNIKRLVRKLHGLRSLSGSKVWVGGGINVTTGGHIHFGIKGLSSEAKDMLYDMVAEPVLVFQSEKRRGNEQGNWTKAGGSILRDQPHGCEWRPLPSFIVNEEVTASILSTAYAILKSWRYYGYKRKEEAITVEDYRKIPLYSAYKVQIDNFIKLFVEKKEKVVLQKKDIFSEWKIDKIRKEWTVDIITQADWLNNYFTPVNVKLKKPVKLEIRFTGNVISTFGLKKEYLEGLEKFAEEHYLPPIVINEAQPKGQTRHLICLPDAWYHMTGKTTFCNNFKGILKNLILMLGGK